ncbi:MAG: glycosyltransferase family 4 protein [Spirochaetes bacterium]|nr:glycosyltransferase family 4 protein [Spirochaetota bacterium]
MIELYIFHYHLLPGGVTSVIRDGVKAAGKYMEDIHSITLITGKRENTGDVITGIKKYFDQIKKNITLRFKYLPGMDYVYPGKFLIDDFNKKAVTLAEELINQFGSSSGIWWVHNHHLGKNPVFTQAMLNITEKYKDQRIIFQIHDFPESGRFENLKFLKSNITSPLYPVTKSVRYAVINTRDRDILIKSGIPDGFVYLLENPVEIFSTGITEAEKESVRNKIFDYFRKKGLPDRSPVSILFKEGKIALYPVRSIRRKNVLEAAALTLLVPGKTNLFVTLPGVSKHEKPYSDSVKKLYAEGFIPGLFGIGSRLDLIGISFADMMAAGDTVLSSSVQEGFGFLFIQSMLRGIPLIARKIDVLAGIEDIFINHPHFFYSEFLCPVQKKDRKLLIDEYKQKLSGIKNLLPEISIEKAEAELNMELDNEMVDFSFLNIPLQIKTIKKLQSEEYKTELYRANNFLMDKLQSFLHKSIDINSYKKNIEIIEKRFGYRAFAFHAERIVDSFKDAGILERERNKIKSEQIETSVIDNFLKKDYLRLIYE